MVTQVKGIWSWNWETFTHLAPNILFKFTTIVLREANTKDFQVKLVFKKLYSYHYSWFCI